LDYASDISSDDQVMTFSDVSVVVDPESVELINGTEIDFIEEGFNQVFKFKNPNAAGECGCGESFNI
jgi:iron-sulfur cluster assembly protein